MESTPTGRTVKITLAVPVLSTGTVIREVVPFRKVTEPVVTGAGVVTLRLLAVTERSSAAVLVAIDKTPSLIEPV
jgi:threonine dehydrogenase-like Zn-dependent dehydrogenase